MLVKYSVELHNNRRRHFKSDGAHIRRGDWENDMTLIRIRTLRVYITLVFIVCTVLLCCLVRVSNE